MVGVLILLQLIENRGKLLFAPLEDILFCTLFRTKLVDVNSCTVKKKRAMHTEYGVLEHLIWHKVTPYFGVCLTPNLVCFHTNSVCFPTNFFPTPSSVFFMLTQCALLLTSVCIFILTQCAIPLIMVY